MAARAITRKINGKPQASWMKGILRPPGLDRIGTIPYTASSDTVRTKGKGYVELWDNKFVLDQQQRLLAPAGILGTEDRGDFDLKNQFQDLLPQEVETPLLSVQHHYGSRGGGQGFLRFKTTSPKSSPQRKLVSVWRLGLHRPGPFDLPRQAVEGVVCITTKDAFLLYNPTAGVTSPWIETTNDTQKGRQVKSIALGFDPQSRKHKVICISSYVIAPVTTQADEQVVVEVLDVHDGTWTYGEHKWRKLKDDQVPLPGERVALGDYPVYLDGKIHWQYHRSFPYVLKFDVGKETFLLTAFPIPLTDELMDFPQKTHSMLMVVDGNIAILKSTLGQETSFLWICHRNEGGWPENDWSEEEVFTGTYLYFTHSDRTAYYKDEGTPKNSNFACL